MPYLMIIPYVFFGILVLTALVRVHGNDPLSEARAFWIVALWPLVLVLVVVELLGHAFMWAARRL